MSVVMSSSNTDLQPSGCVICGDPDTNFGVLCRAHQGIFALAAWVDAGLIGDWDPDIARGVAQLNHRTMLIHPPIGPIGPIGSIGPVGPTAPALAGMGWADQFAIIMRRFGWWVGMDRDGDAEPEDPWRDVETW